jgi:Domain of unknown function (DUF4157)
MKPRFELATLPQRRQKSHETAPPESGAESDSAPRFYSVQQAGNQAVEELLRHSASQKFQVVPPNSPDEAQANRAAERGAHPAPDSEARAHDGTNASSSSHPFLQSPGRPLDPSTRRTMESRFGRSFDDVRLHTGDAAARSARALNARAYTVGPHITFDSSTPESASDQKLLAHELAHVSQGSPAHSALSVRRETAAEVVRSYETDWLLFYSVDEKGLANRMMSIVNAGNYSFATDVLRATPSTDRDEVVGYMMPQLSIKDLIAINKKVDGPALLTLMKDEIGGGYTSREEYNASELLAAVLAPGYERDHVNKKRILSFKTGAANDLESLANMFEDDQIIDDGTVTGRLQAILSATQHLVIPGLQTGIDFKDTGFRGEPTPTGSGFRDPHPSSANQVGHFLTAVGLEISPEVVSKPLFGFGSVREMVDAPATMSDAEVALRLTIGHEKAPDPNGAMDVALEVGAVWLIESLKSGPEGETEEEKKKRVGKAVGDEVQHQIDEIIAAFRRQFKACTDADVAAWNEALANYRADPNSLEAPGNALDRIAVDPTMKGNSRQDLRLSLVGWRLGEMIHAGEFADGKAVAAWIRKNLGPTSAP